MAVTLRSQLLEGCAVRSFVESLLPLCTLLWWLGAAGCRVVDNSGKFFLCSVSSLCWMSEPQVSIMAKLATEAIHSNKQASIGLATPP